MFPLCFSRPTRIIHSSERGSAIATPDALSFTESAPVSRPLAIFGSIAPFCTVASSRLFHPTFLQSLVIAMVWGEAGVAHNDIKPANMMWGENNVMTLIDFGGVTFSKVSRRQLRATVRAPRPFFFNSVYAVGG